MDAKEIKCASDPEKLCPFVSVATSLESRMSALAETVTRLDATTTRLIDDVEEIKVLQVGDLTSVSSDGGVRGAIKEIRSTMNRLELSVDKLTKVVEDQGKDMAEARANVRAWVRAIAGILTLIGTVAAVAGAF